jgi:C-terminal processing protease CtpA/Prc
MKKYEDKSLAYIKIKAMNKNTQYTDQIEIKKFLESIKDYNGLIIDIRDNGGGYESYWTYNFVEPLTNKNLSVDYITAFKDSEYIKPFMESSLILDFKLKPVSELPDNNKFPKELKKDFSKFVINNKTVSPEYPVNFKGKIYLLVNEGTFSAAESFASFSKATKWATLVGTPTGGDGVGQGPIYASLPNTGLVIRFPYTLGLNPDGTANEETHSQPDIYCEQSYNDFINYVKWSRANSNKDQVNPYDTVINNIVGN